MPTLLGQIAERHHWTPADGVRAFERTARDLGEPVMRTISERQWERWCAGKVRSRPQPAACRVLEAMTGHSIDELLAAVPAPVPERISGIDPRGLLHMATRRARAWISQAEASSAGPETLAQIRDELGVLAQAYPREPLPTILPDLVDVQAGVFRLLEGRHSPDTSRDLYLYAGVSSGLVAKASHDLAEPRSALTHARLAYLCATHADHAGLRAWIRGLQSLIAYWADWPQDALRYAQTGAEEASALTGTTAAWLASLEARALARLGRPVDARHALDRAEDLREHVRADELDELGGLLTFTRPRQLYYRADTTVLLPGDATETEQEAQDAVDAYERAVDDETSFSDLAGSRADLALARVRRGEVAGAHEALQPILDLPPEQRIGGIIPSVLRVAHAIQAPALAGAAETATVQGEIEEFVRRRLPVLPQ